MTAEIGQIYVRATNPNQLIIITSIHPHTGKYMTVSLSPDLRDGWRSGLGLKLGWRPLGNRR